MDTTDFKALLDLLDRLNKSIDAVVKQLVKLNSIAQLYSDKELQNERNASERSK